MAIQSEFRISVGDDPDHEELTAEIYFCNQFIALISQERGLEAADIELYASDSGQPWTFKLKEFLDILSQAKQKLWELRRIP